MKFICFLKSEIAISLARENLGLLQINLNHANLIGKLENMLINRQFWRIESKVDKI